MPDPDNKTFATRFLDEHQNIRSSISESPGFVAWKIQFPDIIVDGIKFYVYGGDQLKEEDELILMWAGMNDLLPGNEK